jgi:hypothetical protein
LEQALEIAKRARNSNDQRKRAEKVPKKQNSSDGKRQVSVSKTVTEEPSFPVAETVTTAPVMDTVNLPWPAGPRQSKTYLRQP